MDFCDRLLENKDIKIKQLNVFFIGPEDNMNLSVSAPFMRAGRIPEAGMDCEIKINNEEIKRQTLKPALSQIEKYWGKPEFFLEQASSFLNELTLQNLGRDNQDMIFRNKLVGLQKNLLQVVAKNKQSGELKSKLDDLMQTLPNKDEKSAMSGVKNLFENSTDETEKQIEAYFQKIFTLLDQKNDYSFDQLSSNRVTRALEINKVEIEEVEEISSLEVKFECPITFEEDLPVLYIKNTYQTYEDRDELVEYYPPVLRDISKPYQDYLISNPLAMLDDAELIAKIKKRFDQVIGLNTTVELCKNNQPLTSLVTRESISSFISTSNEPSHRRATHYALADLFFGEKLCGVPELWLAVVYFIAKNSEHLNTEHNFSHFIENFKNNLMRELKNNNTYITLSGLSTHGPLLKVPVALAVWYCVVSPKLDNLPNRLRAIGTTHHLKLLDELNYPYDEKWTLHQLAIYKAYAVMLKQAKQDPKKLNNWVRSLYQNSLTSDNTLIMLDGSPQHDPNSVRIFPENIGKPIELCLTEDQYSRGSDDLLNTLSVGEILALAKLADPSKKAEAVDIPNNFLELAIPSYKENYNSSENTTKHKTEICPLTLRPYSIDPSSKKKWLVAAEEKFGPLAGQISAYNYFIRYVSEENKFPSQEQFIRWLAEKQTQREVDPKDTLPKSILTIVDNLFNSFTTAVGKFFSDVYSEQAKVFFKNYEKAKAIYASKKNSFTLEDMPIELFKEITEKSRDKDRRMELESRCDTFDRKVINASGFFEYRSSQSAESTLYSDISTPKLVSK